MRTNLSILLLLIFITGCSVILVSCSNNLCSNTEIKRYSSPDNIFEAVIFFRDCGSTTGQSFQLSIVKQGEEVGNAKGNIYITNDDFTVNWKSASELEVIGSSDDIFKKESKYKKLNISYRE